MFFIHAHARTACATAISLCLVSVGLFPVSGRAANAEAPVDLSHAIAQALRHNPDLAGTAYLLRADDARIAQSGLRPTPELSVQVEDFAGTGRAQGFSGAQATFALSQTIELGGRRDRRISAAEAARDLTRIDTQARQLDVLAEVTRRFIEVAAGQERLALSHRGVELARRTVDDVRQRVEAAKAPEVDLHRARIAQSRALLAEENAEHELLSARYKLAAMWGATDDRFGAIEADLYRLPEVATFESLAVRLKANPDFLRFATEGRLRDAEVRLAESRRRPDIQLAAGVRRLQDTRDEALVASIAIPLFTGDRAEAHVAQAQSQRALVDVHHQAALVRVRAQLFELYQELHHALIEAKTLRDEVLPAQEAVLEQAQTAYQRGRYSYLDWTAAQAELLEARRALIEAAADAHRYLADIERLTGEPVATSPN
jgi:outer membrane protein, heavy metal efflux system